MFIQSHLVSSESHNIRHKHQACHLEIELLSSFGHSRSFLLTSAKNRTWCCCIKGIIMSTSSLKLTKI